MRYTAGDLLAAQAEMDYWAKAVRRMERTRRLEEQCDIAEEWFREARRTTVAIRWMYEANLRQAKDKHKMIAAARAKDARRGIQA